MATASGDDAIRLFGETSESGFSLKCTKENSHDQDVNGVAWNPVKSGILASVRYARSPKENLHVFRYSRLFFSAELKPRGNYLELFWQADFGYIGQALIGFKVPNSSHVASIQL